MTTDDARLAALEVVRALTYGDPAGAGDRLQDLADQFGVEAMLTALAGVGQKAMEALTILRVRDDRPGGLSAAEAELLGPGDPDFDAAYEYMFNVMSRPED